MLTFLDIGLLNKILYAILYSINQILWWVGITKQDRRYVLDRLVGMYCPLFDSIIYAVDDGVVGLINRRKFGRFTRELSISRN